ncbi:MAG: SoxR reducing system RseC family protein [Gammaproteobacteria bacterium]|nr:SoxR reducing system RseC family protein [Gammaproteobacteria bacterium]
MIEARARVVAVDSDLAEVTTLRQSACGSCDARNGCGTSLIAAWFPQRQLRFRLRNTIGAQPGDTVIVGLNEAMLQRTSLLLYGAPLLGLLAGALLGERIAGAMTVASELGGVGGGLLGLTAGLAWVRAASRRHVRRRDVDTVRLLRQAVQSADSGVAEIPLPFGRNLEKD